MAKRKKYPRLPNGYGSIKYLGKNRRNPYGVYPPATEQDETGEYVRPKALCYVSEYMTGIKVLMLYHEGRFAQGDMLDEEVKTVTDIINSSTRKQKKDSLTFAQVYEAYYEDKFKNPNYSKSSRYAAKSAYQNSAALHDIPFDEIVHADMQKIIDDLPRKKASKELLVHLYHQMFEYAIICHIVDRDESRSLKVRDGDEDESGVPFTEDDLKILWKNKRDPVAEMILIMCYSGFRISEYANLEVNLEEKYFKGGIKTKAGKDRTVPIHSAILPLVEARIRREKQLLGITPQAFRISLYEALTRFGIEKHTPHDTRHTFSMLCEKYGVSERDQKRMLGHAFSDVTNKVYGHRDLDSLREEIEKIQASQF